jgi:hypothetical protein
MELNVGGGGGVVQALECEWVGFMTIHNAYLSILDFVKDAPRRANDES